MAGGSERERAKDDWEMGEIERMLNDANAAKKGRRPGPWQWAFIAANAAWAGLLIATAVAQTQGAVP